MSYFGEAIAMVEQLQIADLISFHQDFDISIVAHFFATVHFHHDDARTMTWMTNGMQLTATWKDFMDLLQVRDEGLTTVVGLRPHAKAQAAPKEKLLTYLFVKQTPTGEVSWTKTFPGAEFVAPDWVRYEPITLCQKDKWANTSSRQAAPRDSDDDLPGAEDEAPSEAPRQVLSVIPIIINM
ncbi:hypothetical protein D1007_02216 [Hordeum vulgare]|nr:hypothetical protein D1007_02216 [Hordeum vulgare]